MNKIADPIHVMDSLRYVPFETVVDSAFWHLLANKKLEEYCLDEAPRPMFAEYSINVSPGLNPRVTIDSNSLRDFPNRKMVPSFIFKFKGKMIVFNTLDTFKAIEKQGFINKYGTEIFKDAVTNMQFLKNPDMLLSILLLTYCDLKRHKFYFWFAYPAVLHKIQPSVVRRRRLDDEFSSWQTSIFLKAYDNWRSEHSEMFFIVCHKDDSITIHSCSDLDLNMDGLYLGFCDPSTDEEYPGWPLRNMLYAISATMVNEKISLPIICLRERYNQGQRSCDHSLVLYVELSHLDPDSLNQFVGWEKCDGMLKPRVADLSASMDPAKLAASAVDLNLKLMKWRLMPELNVDIFRNIKCLLIGAGTLGCNVARQLMGWGVRYITFIDNGNVSLSNPVRQSLFNFDDAKSGGKCKADVAARALTKIFPGIRATGHHLSIPMPGHPISDRCVVKTLNLPKELNATSEKLDLPPSYVEAYESSARLSEMIKLHDVVFLLTDTRESRWLPSVLAKVHGKLVINVALGFDTYLVMRHGITVVDDIPCKETICQSNTSVYRDQLVGLSENYLSASELGCYFCNDVVGPANSTQNRSLDQQCTVTRPGASMMAAAIAVELLISILQHPLRYNAPAEIQHESDLQETSLSLVPHQIRGFLSAYKTILPTTHAFKSCSACSQPVINAFKADGFQFLVQVLNDSTYLENICGLTELHINTDEADVVALSDSDDL